MNTSRELPDEISAFVRLEAKINQFNSDRNWQKFHAPKNLAMALSVEASELVEIFQWLTAEESDAVKGEVFENVKDEVADVQIYLIQLAARLAIDIEKSVEEKLEKNAVRFPAT